MESISPQDYYVYTYRYPESMGGAIFYVGKGQTYNDNVDRIDMHEEEVRRGMQSKKCDAIREIWDAGEQVVKEKVAFFKNEEDAYLYEWGLINMTTYSENLTNVSRGRGSFSKSGLVKYNVRARKIRSSESKYVKLKRSRAICECPVCRHSFFTAKIFNKHRIGSFHNKTRRCMTIDEMRDAGMGQNEKGHWVFVSL